MWDHYLYRYGFAARVLRKAFAAFGVVVLGLVLTGCTLTIRHEVYLKRPDWLPAKATTTQPTSQPDDTWTLEDVLK